MENDYADNLQRRHRRWRLPFARRENDIQIGRYVSTAAAELLDVEGPDGERICDVVDRGEYCGIFCGADGQAEGSAL